MGCIEGEMGGEVEDTEPELLLRLIRPPNDPSIFLHERERQKTSEVSCLAERRLIQQAVA